MARPTVSVDSLGINIGVTANNSSQALNTLINDIGRLSNALSGMDMNNIINQMKGFGSAVNGINAKPLVQNVNKLTTATSRYATALNKMNSANRAYNSNLSNLSNSSYRVTSMLQRFNDKIGSFTSRMKNANKETKNFAQTVGLLYARFFLLIRGVKMLTNQVKSSMDYIEVLNYFDSSMGQVAERGVSKWAEMGYDSAEAYYESFSSRAKQVTKQMSGFFPEANGTLTAGRDASLGMNPQQLMQYQAQYAQMASSMGMASEQALKLSEVYTKLGSDLASVKNLDFNEVWTNLASGMVGMSRTMDRFGVNIRSANMQAKLTELGINANVNALSQADKALLRTIIILDSTKYAWGDLAETLNTPANQFRMLTNNVKLLGQMIGNILLPVVAKILPYLNAFVMALQRLFTWLAKVLGIDLTDLMAQNETPDNSALSDMLDDAEGLGDALDKDADGAKKLKKQLQGFDALNNLTSKDDTTGALDNLKLSGLLDQAFNDAIEKYLAEWRKAFAKLKNDAKDIADKISNFFVSLFAPVRRAWAKVSDDFVKSWKRAFSEVRKLVNSFMISFWRVWGEDKTQKIFENIFSIVSNIGKIVGNLAERFRLAWDENFNGYKILRAIRDIILTISSGFKDMSDDVVRWSENINFAPMLSRFGEFLNAVNGAVGALMKILRDFLNKVLLPLAKWTIESGLPTLFEVITNAINSIDWNKLFERLSKLWDSIAPFAQRVGGGLLLFFEQVGEKIAKLVNGKMFGGLITLLEKLLDSLTEQDIAELLWGLVYAFVGFKVALGAFKLTNGILNMYKFFKDLAPLLRIVSNGFAKLGGSIRGTKLFTATLGRLGKAIQGTVLSLGGTGANGLAGIFEFFSMDLGAILTSGGMVAKFTAVGSAIGGGILAGLVGLKIGNKIGQLLFPKDEKLYENFKWMGEGGFFDSVAYMFTDMIPDAFSGMVSKISSGLEPLKNKISETFNSVKENTVASLTSARDAVSEVWNGIGEWFSTNVSEPIASAFENLKNSRLAQIFEGIGIIFEGMWTQGRDALLTNVIQPIEELWSHFVEWFDTTIVQPFQEKWSMLSTIAYVAFVYLYNGAVNIWTNFRNWFVSTIIEPLSNAWNSFKTVSIAIFQGAWEGIQGIWASAVNWFSTNIAQPLKETFGYVVDWIKEDFNILWNFLSSGFSSVFNSIIGVIEGAINLMIGGLNKVIGVFNQIVSYYAQIAGRNWSGIQGFGNIKLGRYAELRANGGFPDAGQLFIAREAGAEMVGAMNGKTTVANNDQIVDGISAGVYNANLEQNALLQEQNSLLRAILEKDTGISEGALFKSVQKSASSYYKMTGNKAFA